MRLKADIGVLSLNTIEELLQTTDDQFEGPPEMRELMAQMPSNVKRFNSSLIRACGAIALEELFSLSIYTGGEIDKFLRQVPDNAIFLEKLVDLLMNESDLLVFASLTRAFSNLMKQMPPPLLEQLVQDGNLVENILTHIEKMNDEVDGNNLQWLCIETTHLFIELLHVLGLLCSLR